MRDVFICDAIRTPIGRFGGGLSTVRADDLAALPIKALMARNLSVDWNAVDEVFLGCANQSGEDNRNVARMAAAAGRPACRACPGVTVNRLCASGMDAVGAAFRAIASGEMDAGDRRPGSSRCPVPRIVMGKADSRVLGAHNEAGRHHVGLALRQPVALRAEYGVDSHAGQTG
jgi:3-oxoadipyl-CoA thiolase